MTLLLAALTGSLTAVLLVILDAFRSRRSPAEPVRCDGDTPLVQAIEREAFVTRVERGLEIVPLPECIERWMREYLK